MIHLAQIEQGIELVDKVTQQSDRWLFLAAVIVLLAFVGLVIRWLVASMEEKDRNHAAERVALATEVKTERENAKAENKAEREAAKADRKEERDKFLAVIENMQREISKVGEAIEANTEILTKHDTDMRQAHSLEVSAIVRAELSRLGINIDDLPFTAGQSKKPLPPGG